MLVSLEWLKKYVETRDLTPLEIADQFTKIGLEVEVMSTIDPFHSGILVGKILSVGKHPNADKLNLCKVDVGEKTLDIVCGASNVREGLFVCVATLGSVLPDGYKLKPSKIRGVASEGMMCSEKELGLSDSHEGIMELEESVVLGSSFDSFCPRGDVVYDLSVTPNRGDCLSYVGIARDLSARLQSKFSLPKIDEFTLDKTAANHVPVEVKEPTLCARFTTLRVDQVRVIDSPLWLKMALSKAGMRPINLIVDVTNYVMLETGQPLHAYDLDSLKGGKLTVCCAGDEEKFQTLDGKTVELRSQDLVIADDERSVAIAGVMGGENSDVGPETTSIVLEVAQFNATSVRRTKKHLAIQTEAAFRFERGVDLENLSFVAKRACGLICKALGIEGQPVSSFDYYPTPWSENKIAVRLSRTRMLLAMPHLTIDKCVGHLERLGIPRMDSTNERMLFSTPSWRHDLLREVDLIEEIGRIEGLEKIPAELPRMNIAPSKEDELIGFVEKTRRNFAFQGLHEVITYPFTSLKDYSQLSLDENHFLYPSIKLQNALSEEQSFMRSTLVVSLLRSLTANRNRGNRNIRLFEIGRNYFHTSKNESAQNIPFFSQMLTSQRYLSQKAKEFSRTHWERTLLAGVMDHPFVEKNWNTSEVQSEFIYGKGLIQRWLKSFALPSCQYKRIREEDLPFLNPKASAWVESEVGVLGWIGELHPRVSDQMDLGLKPVLCFEFDLELVLELLQKRKLEKSEIQKYPPVERDLAFEVSEDLCYGDFMNAVFSNPRKKHLRDVRLFDIYQGEQLQEHKKSLAASYRFQSEKKTLTDKDVDREILELTKWLKETVGADQR